MLFCYPATAIGENWLHDAATAIIDNAFAAYIAGNIPLAWSSAIPAKHREALKRKTGLKKHYIEICRCIAALEKDDQELARRVFFSQNAIPGVFDGITPSWRISDFPGEVGQAILDLFSYCFDKLSKWTNPGSSKKIRDDYYANIYNGLSGHYCPFCGIDRFDAPHPDMPRHHLDHYMPISIYPSAGVNLRNLLPMCARCNSSFKEAQDVLRDTEGNRRVCLDPFVASDVKISLARSNLLDGASPSAHWEIDFIPPLPAFETWDAVFQVRFRYRESILNAEAGSWLEEFVVWAIDAKIDFTSKDEVATALGRYRDVCTFKIFMDQNFLRAPFFSALKDKCENSPDGNLVFSWVQSAAQIFAEIPYGEAALP